MFNELVECTVNRKAGRRGWTIAVSMMLQTIGLLILLLIPLLYTQALPRAFLSFYGTLTTPIALEPAPAPVKAPPPTGEPRRSLFDKGGVLHEPTGIPRNVYVFQEPEPPPELPGDANSGVGWSLFNNLRDSGVEGPPPPAPIRIQRIRQSQIQPAMILAQPQPIYPPLARNARIQGDVVLHAIIDREGHVAELQVISGHPVLAQAALAAVRNWRYQPTLLSGEPVEVETTITVSFVLGG